MRRAGKETEIKLRIENAAGVRARLLRAGFRVVQKRALERNLLYDTPAGALRRLGLLLRLRSVGRRHRLTMKGPSRPARHFKVREEVETEVSNPKAIAAALAGLGYRPFFRYEKLRTVFAARNRWRGGEVMIDETPIGAFVELEGPQAWIRRAAAELFAARPRAFITANYRMLYHGWCRRNRRRPGDMTFRRGADSP